MSQLSKNTTDLDALIAKANALPDAVDTSDADATASDIVSPKTAYVNGEKVTGNIPSKSSSDLTVSGAAVNVPAGHYKNAASKAVPTATQATPSITVDANGLITAKTTQSAGYVASGTKSATKQLTTQAAKTVIPTTSEQTAVAAGVFTTGAVKVAAIEDLTAALNAQETLISELEAELEGKAAGGGGVETCTVTVTGIVGQELFYTTVIDGKIRAVYCGPDDNGTYVLTNIVCGSVVRFAGTYMLREASDGIFLSGYSNVSYEAPLTAGTTATVSLVQD